MPSSVWIVIVVAFVIGVLLFSTGTAILRSLQEESPAAAPSWPRLVDDSLERADVQLRLDIVERLAIVESDWSRDILERARSEESDARVRSAIDLALRR